MTTDAGSDKATATDLGDITNGAAFGEGVGQTADDTYDVYKFSISSGGVYNITMEISDVSGNYIPRAVWSLYTENSAHSVMSDDIEAGNFKTTSGMFFGSGIYYFEVANWLHSYKYNILIGQSQGPVPVDSVGDVANQASDIGVVSNGAQFSESLGRVIGDTEDWYKFTIQREAAYDINISLSNKTSMVEPDAWVDLYQVGFLNPVKSIWFKGTSGSISGYSLAPSQYFLRLRNSSNMFDYAVSINATAPCFLRGTMILTARGKVAVEYLRTGDRLLTLSHEFRPVTWIGRRSYTAEHLAGDDRAAVLPIRIRMGALGHGVPHRDLYVSPGHALYCEDTLIPASALVNGLSITQEDKVERIDYFHVLLDQHEVIWAEGAAAESYEIHGNLKGFSNWAEYVALCGGEPGRSPQDCFPRRYDGPMVERLRAALLERAEVLGFSRTADPALKLVIDGCVVEPTTVKGRRYKFELPTRPGELRLTSRTTVLAELHGHGDGRRLGVPIQRLTLSGVGVVVEIGPDFLTTGEGFHQSESTHRWTDGDARLPIGLLACLPEGPLTVEVHLIETALSYYVPPTAEVSGRACFLSREVRCSGGDLSIASHPAIR